MYTGALSYSLSRLRKVGAASIGNLLVAARLKCCPLLAVGACVLGTEEVSLGLLANPTGTSVLKLVGGIFIPRGLQQGVACRL